MFHQLFQMGSTQAESWTQNSLVKRCSRNFRDTYLHTQCSHNKILKLKLTVEELFSNFLVQKKKEKMWIRNFRFVIQFIFLCACCGIYVSHGICQEETALQLLKNFRQAMEYFIWNGKVVVLEEDGPTQTVKRKVVESDDFLYFSILMFLFTLF